MVHPTRKYKGKKNIKLAINMKIKLYIISTTHRLNSYIKVFIVLLCTRKLTSSLLFLLVNPTTKFKPHTRSVTSHKTPKSP